MVKVFAKRLTELRRKKGITQKQAALSLGISQALLSHYENGVRECGLDFLVKAASFYEVTCDYLLGREKKESRSLSPIAREKQRLKATEYVLFDLLKQTGSEQLLEQATDFLALAYYRLYRRLYCGGHPSPGEFKTSDYTYRALADAAMQVSEARLRCVLSGQDIGELHSVDITPLMTDRQTLQTVYGNDYILLEQLMKKAEKQFKE
ncbi:MAG: helix-turn-helix transcriptional regulator [Clostridia bacterium]|nr:helix-turn-helix transcriptional regulator [Clostridia bacterium]